MPNTFNSKEAYQSTLYAQTIKGREEISELISKQVTNIQDLAGPTPDETAEKILQDLEYHEPEVVGYILARAIDVYRKNLAQTAEKAQREINFAAKAASEFEAGIEQFLPKAKK